MSSEPKWRDATKQIETFLCASRERTLLATTNGESVFLFTLPRNAIYRALRALHLLSMFCRTEESCRWIDDAAHGDVRQVGIFISSTRAPPRYANVFIIFHLAALIARSRERRSERSISRTVRSLRRVLRRLIDTFIIKWLGLRLLSLKSVLHCTCRLSSVRRSAGCERQNK